jgi:hypothetical protein
LAQLCYEQFDGKGRLAFGFESLAYLDWKFVTFYLYVIEGWDDGDYDCLAHAMEWVGCEEYWQSMRLAVINRSCDPVVIVENEYYEFQVLDGMHRLGIAHVEGSDRLPAYVGFQPKTPAK